MFSRRRHWSADTGSWSPGSHQDHFCLHFIWGWNNSVCVCLCNLMVGVSMYAD